MHKLGFKEKNIKVGLNIYRDKATIEDQRCEFENIILDIKSKRKVACTLDIQNMITFLFFTVVQKAKTGCSERKKSTDI